MSDSTADTNIPVTRLPFGTELPPKVPYSTTDSVGVGDAASENLPVQVNNRQIVPVGTSSNPIRAVHLKRKSSGKTVNDVPTSDTPNADDPDTMIATKQYVESHVKTKLGTAGGNLKHIYTANGEIKESTGTLNSDGVTLVKMASGTWSEVSDKSVGADTANAVKPVVLASGKVVAASKSSGSTVKPVYVDGGAIKPITATKGGPTTPVYFDNGEIKEGNPIEVSVTGGAVRYRTVLTCCNVRDKNSTRVLSSQAGEVKYVKDVITNSGKYGVYTVQTNCILGIWAGANCGSIGSEIACVWMNCAVPNTSGVMSNTWVVVNQFAEFLGGIDNNRQIFINVCAGTQFRFAFGKQTFDLSAGNGKTVVAEGSYKSGNFLNVAATSGMTAGDKNDCGKVIFTEFSLSTTSSGGEGGEDDEGGSGGDGGGGDGGGGDSDTTPLTILSVASKKSGSDTAATSTYCTYSSKKFTFSIPKESASSLLIDFCSELPGGTMSLKIKTVTSYSVDTAVESFLTVAYSQQLPNNVSGFQMCLPMSSFETAADNFTMTIEGADNCHHANITLLRS